MKVVLVAADSDGKNITLYHRPYTKPHPKPKPNDRGLQIVREFYPMAKTLLRSQ